MKQTRAAAKIKYVFGILIYDPCSRLHWDFGKGPDEGTLVTFQQKKVNSSIGGGKKQGEMSLFNICFYYKSYLEKCCLSEEKSV